MKTNAVRQLERAGVVFACRLLEIDEAKSGDDVAALLGVPPARVGKTLVTRGASGKIHIFVVPAGRRLDLQLAAKAAGERKIRPVERADVFDLTGYRPGGCSPFAMTSRYRTFVDRHLLDEKTILVSGGAIGLQLELSPGDLVAEAGAAVADLTGADGGGQQA